MNLYKKCTEKSYSFQLLMLLMHQVIYVLERILHMTIDDKIRDEKMQCNIDRGAAKMSALSSGKIDK